jgi:DNA-binding MarR family transcriptional regulator
LRPPGAPRILRRMESDPLTCACLNVRAAARRITRRYDEVLAPSGLLASQFSMLNFIAAKPGCGVAELADWMDMDVSTATRNLRSLQTGGYIAIRSGARDARRREIRLTAKGGRAVEKAKPLWAKAQQSVVSELGEHRWQQLLTLLTAVSQ